MIKVNKSSRKWLWYRMRECYRSHGNMYQKEYGIIIYGFVFLQDVISVFVHTSVSRVWSTQKWNSLLLSRLPYPYFRNSRRRARRWYIYCSRRRWNMEDYSQYWAGAMPSWSSLHKQKHRSQSSRGVHIDTVAHTANRRWGVYPQSGKNNPSNWSLFFSRGISPRGVHRIYRSWEICSESPQGAHFAGWVR